jgi:iron complex transport system substrate-binding protein
MRALACCLFVLVGCLSLPAQADIVVDDARGKTVRLQRPAQRIVTLAPNLAELVDSAGAGERLVGVARFSNFPSPVTRLPVVSDALTFDIEAILALKPDLVLAWHSGTPPSVIARLESLGLAVFASYAGRVTDVATAVRQIARLTGTQAGAELSLRRFESALATLRRDVAARDRVRVFYEIWHRPLMTVSDRHFAGDVIRLCGGENVFGDAISLTPEVSLEALLSARPDVVVGGGSSETADSLRQRWQHMPAPLNALPVVPVPPDLIQRPTLRLADGAALVCTGLTEIRQRSR